MFGGNVSGQGGLVTPEPQTTEDEILDPDVGDLLAQIMAANGRPMTMRVAERKPVEEPKVIIEDEFVEDVVVMSESSNQGVYTIESTEIDEDEFDRLMKQLDVEVEQKVNDGAEVDDELTRLLSELEEEVSAEAPVVTSEEDITTMSKSASDEEIYKEIAESNDNHATGSAYEMLDDSQSLEDQLKSLMDENPIEHEATVTDEAIYKEIAESNDNHATGASYEMLDDSQSLEDQLSALMSANPITKSEPTNYASVADKAVLDDELADESTITESNFQQANDLLDAGITNEVEVSVGVHEDMPVIISDLMTSVNNQTHALQEVYSDNIVTEDMLNLAFDEAVKPTNIHDHIVDVVIEDKVVDDSQLVTADMLNALYADEINTEGSTPSEESGDSDLSREDAKDESTNTDSELVTQDVEQDDAVVNQKVKKIMHDNANAIMSGDSNHHNDTLSADDIDLSLLTEQGIFNEMYAFLSKVVNKYVTKITSLEEEIATLKATPTSQSPTSWEDERTALIYELANLQEENIAVSMNNDKLKKQIAELKRK